MQTLNRRDLLLLGISRKTRSIELSCERLYMKFCDSHLDNTTQELFERLGSNCEALTISSWWTPLGWRARILDSDSSRFWFPSGPVAGESHIPVNP